MAPLDRRRFLGLATGGVAALGFGIQACSADRDQPEAEPSPSIGGTLNLFSWEEYSNPENLDEFSQSTGVEVVVEVYDSDEQAIESLQSDPGRYDLVVPSDSYVPGMIAAGLLLPLDHARIPNLANADSAFLDKPWDPGNRHTMVKSWGSSGFLYDTGVIPEVLVSWDDFYVAAERPEVSGMVTALAERSVVDMTLWRAGADWRTDDPALLDAAQQALTGELLPHLAALDSYPVEGLLDGSYVLSQAFSGDARTVVLEFPDRFRWVMPTPHTDLWVDSWAIPADAPNPDAAHAFIDFMLRPNISARDMNFHGYATAVQGVDEFLPFDLPARDMVFFTEEQRARMLVYEVPATEERRNEIVAALQEALG